MQNATKFLNLTWKRIINIDFTIKKDYINIGLYNLFNNNTIIIKYNVIYKIANIIKFNINNSVETIKIGCTSLSLPLHNLIKQKVINPAAIPYDML